MSECHQLYNFIHQNSDVEVMFNVTAFPKTFE